MLRDQIVNKTPFRESERFYKKKCQTVSYEDAVDFDRTESIHGNADIQSFIVTSDEPSLNCFTTSNQLQVFSFRSQPGLTVIRNALNPECQRLLVRKALSEYTALNMTNLDIHYDLQTGILQQVVEERKGSGSLVNPHSKDVSQQVGYEITPLTDPTSKLPSQLLPKLRWCSLGLQYNWFTKLYEQNNETAQIDQFLQQLSLNFIVQLSPYLRICHGAIGAGGDMIDDKPEVYVERRRKRDGANMISAQNIKADVDVRYTNYWSYDRAQHWKAEAGIVNFYNYKDSLTAHVDRSEINLESPLISYSLGNSCVFLISCTGVNSKPLAVILKSGDVLIMSAEARRAHHGVPRIIEGTCPEYLQSQCCVDSVEYTIIDDYIANARININLRQVFYH